MILVLLVTMLAVLWMMVMRLMSDHVGVDVDDVVDDGDFSMSNMTINIINFPHQHDHDQT